MTDKKLNLKGGVLIVGSLLWQDYLLKNDNTIRKKILSKTTFVSLKWVKRIAMQN